MSQHKQHTDLNPSNDPLPNPAGGSGLPRRPAQPSVGQRLKVAREHSGQELRHVAQALNIRYPYLQALEECQYDKLPGTAYALGFLRTYSQYLGLDSRELVRQYKAEESGTGKQTQLVFPTPQPESRIPSGAIILITVVLFGVVYGLWSHMSQDESAVADLVPEIPERLQPLVLGDLPAQAEGQADTPAASEVVAAVPQPFGLGSDEPLTSVPGEARELVQEPGFVMPTPDPVPGLPAEPQGPIQASPDAGLEAGPLDETAAVEEPSPAVTTSEPVQPEPAPVEQAAEAPAETVTLAAPPQAARTPVTPAQPAAPDSAEAPTSTQSAVLPGSSAETDATAGSSGQTVPMTLLPSPDAIPSAPSTEGATQIFQDTAPRVYGSENSDARVVVRATQDSWVQVRDVDDTLLLTRILRAGDTYRVPNRLGLKMLTGNAGGLEVVVDGATVGPLGAIDKVRRDISLDPERLLPAGSVSQ